MIKTWAFILSIFAADNVMQVGEEFCVPGGVWFRFKESQVPGEFPFLFFDQSVLLYNERQIMINEDAVAVFVRTTFPNLEDEIPEGEQAAASSGATGGETDRPLSMEAYNAAPLPHVFLPAGHEITYMGRTWRIPRNLRVTILPSISDGEVKFVDSKRNFDCTNVRVMIEEDIILTRPEGDEDSASEEELCDGIDNPGENLSLPAYTEVRTNLRIQVHFTEMFVTYSEERNEFRLIDKAVRFEYLNFPQINEDIDESEI